MRAYFNMPTSEFVSQLRDTAIKAGVRPQVIDCIDRLEQPLDNMNAEELEEGACLIVVNNTIDECRAVLKMHAPEKDIGLTETQLDQILELLEGVRP